MFPTLFVPSTQIYIPPDDILLLLHGEGTDGASVITDSSLYNRSPNTNNGVVTKTDSYKFGSSSNFHDGSWFTYATNDGSWNFFGMDEWTIEFFCRSEPAASIVNDHLLTLYLDVNNFFSIHIDPSTHFSMYKYVAGVAVGASTYTTPDTSRWYHRCVMKKGGLIRSYLDGVPHDTMDDTWWNSDNTDLVVGTLSGTYSTWYYHGWMDELRIVKNLAVYNINGFTPPTAPHPDP